MSDQIVPVRFELSINGEHIATGGIDNSLTAVLISHTQPRQLAEGAAADHAAGEYKTERRKTFTVRLIGGESGPEGRHLKWAETPFGIGDEVTVRILGPGSTNDPIETRKGTYEYINAPMIAKGRAVQLRYSEKQYYMCFEAMIENLLTPPIEFRRLRSSFARIAIDLQCSLTMSTPGRRSYLRKVNSKHAEELGAIMSVLISAFEGCRKARQRSALAADEAIAKPPDQDSEGRVPSARLDTDIPIRLRVVVNGQVLATGGLKSSCPSIALTRVARREADILPEIRSRPGFSVQDFLRKIIKLDLGAFDESTDEGQLYRWIKEAPLLVGDEVIVQAIGPGPVDEPVELKAAYGTRELPIVTEHDRTVRSAWDSYIEAFDGVISNIAASDDDYSRHILGFKEAIRAFANALTDAGQHGGPNKETYAIRVLGMRDAIDALPAVLNDFRTWNLRRRADKEANHPTRS